MTPTDQILEVLANVAETDEVRTNPDLALYDLQVLDSMKTVELIVALSAANSASRFRPRNSSAKTGPPRASSSPTSSVASPPESMIAALDRSHIRG